MRSRVSWAEVAMRTWSSSSLSRWGAKGHASTKSPCRFSCSCCGTLREAEIFLNVWADEEFDLVRRELASGSRKCDKAKGVADHVSRVAP